MSRGNFVAQPLNNAEQYAKQRSLLYNIIMKDFLYPQESYLIRGACFEIYKKFRNTLKESIYQRSLFEELKSKGLKVEREKQLPICHLGVKVGVYVPDLVINKVIIIELKAKPFLHKEDIRQFWYYPKKFKV